MDLLLRQSYSIVGFTFIFLHEGSEYPRTAFTLSYPTKLRMHFFHMHDFMNDTTSIYKTGAGVYSWTSANSYS